MKHLRLFAAIAALVLFSACEEEKAPLTNEVDLKVTVKMADIAGRTPSWKAGDIVFFGDNATSRPGFQFTASDSDINGGNLSAVYKKASPDADTLFAIHAPQGRIRKRVTEAINMVYDGTLAGSAVPMGTGLVSSKEITLSPLLPVAEFSIKTADVTLVRLTADKDIFPTSFKYSFASSSIEEMKAGPLVEIPVSGVGPFYVPLVPGTVTTGFTADFLNEGGFSLATATIDAVEINATAGSVFKLGVIDKDAISGGEGGNEFEKAAVAAKNMGVGVNLGGSFEVLWKEYAAQANRNDPSFYERQNGANPTTQATMDCFADAGFKCVRIPITWHFHMDDVSTSTIDKVWMDRIQEVVDYAINAGLYVIINMHHDAHSHEAQGGQWIFADIAHYDQIAKGFKNVWGQIAERFKDYDEKLLFEGYNEITDLSGTWTFPKNAEDIEAANRLNQDFVNVVRRSGSNNLTRNLIVSSYSCSVSSKPIQAFVMPADLREGHLFLQVHNYAPTSFCSFSNATKDTFGDPQDYTDIQNALTTIKTLIVDKGYPCVLGEYGAPGERQASVQQPDGSWRIKRSAGERAKHAYYYTFEALKIGIVPIYWYTPQEGNHRGAGKWTYPEIKDALIKAWTDYQAL